MDILVAFFTDYGYLAVFLVLLLCGFGLPIPEDITLVSGGIIAGLGFANLQVMMFVGMIGILLGDSIVFLMGYYSSEKFLKLRFIKKILTKERFQKVEEAFGKYGNFVLFMARFMPGLRMPIYFTAGTTRKVSYVQFFIIDFIASIISAPLWVYLGYYGANNKDWILETVKQSQIILISVVVLIVLFFLIRFFYKRKKS